MNNPTPTRTQVIEAQQLLTLHAEGKMKFSLAVLDELDRIETAWVWYSMDHPHDAEAAFAAMEQDRQAEVGI